MEIEKEIYNRKFENSHQKAVVNLLYTYGWITNLLRLRLNNHNITLQQYNVLRILRGQYPNPATINILKERMLDKMSDASRIVERLVQKDLVKRCVSNKDRRAVDILISQKGLEILQKLDNEISIKDMLSHNLSEEEAIELSGLLDKMRG
jgi:DNA-binding MarR family transcriptional regulator